jgi:hypothetical protein
METRCLLQATAKGKLVLVHDTKANGVVAVSFHSVLTWALDGVGIYFHTPNALSPETDTLYWLSIRHSGPYSLTFGADTNLCPDSQNVHLTVKLKVFQVHPRNQISYFPLPYPSCDTLTQRNALFNCAVEEQSDPWFSLKFQYSKSLWYICC